MKITKYKEFSQNLTQKIQTTRPKTHLKNPGVDWVLPLNKHLRSSCIQGEHGEKKLLTGLFRAACIPRKPYSYRTRIPKIIQKQMPHSSGRHTQISQKTG